MLQSILLLVSLVLVCVVAAMMGTLGVQSFRPFSALFGFVAGFGAILLIITQIGIVNSSLPLTICAAASGVLFAILSFLYRPVGVALGSIVLGYVYGVGLMSALDMLLNYAIPPFLYTGLSLLFIAAAFIFCAIRTKEGMRAITAYLGAYAIIASVILMVSWYLTNRGGIPASGDDILAFTSTIASLFTSLSGAVKLVLLVLSAALGTFFFLIQKKLIKPKRVRPSELFALDLDNTGDLEEAVNAARAASAEQEKVQPEPKPAPVEKPVRVQKEGEAIPSRRAVQEEAPVPTVKAVPVAEKPAPVAKAASVAERPAPVAKAAPVAERPVPVAKAAPVAEKPVPVAKAAPVAEKPASAPIREEVPVRPAPKMEAPKLQTAQQDAAAKSAANAPRFAPRRSLSDVAKSYHEEPAKLPSRLDRRK